MMFRVRRKVSIQGPHSYCMSASEGRIFVHLATVTAAAATCSLLLLCRWVEGGRMLFSVILHPRLDKG
jgi:hypothetical protein